MNHAGLPSDRPEPLVEIVGTVPHMHPDAIAFLTEVLKGTRCYLEYGSGGSTRLAATLGVSHIYSVESDHEWATHLRAQVVRDIGQRPTRFCLDVPEIGPTGRWGRPTDHALKDQWFRYPTAIWQHIEDDGVSPSLVLVDGRFRLACFLVSLLRTRPGTTIIFDDYAARRGRYGAVERFVERYDSFGSTVIFRRPAQLPVGEIQALLETSFLDWR